MSVSVSFRDWAKSNKIVGISSQIRQGKSAQVLFCRPKGKSSEDALVLVLSKPLGEALGGSTDIMALVDCVVFHGENSKGEKRTYLARSGEVSIKTLFPDL